MITKITNSKEYEMALKRYEKIYKEDILSPEWMEGFLLNELIIEYEDKNFPIEYANADKYFYDDLNMEITDNKERRIK